MLWRFYFCLQNNLISITTYCYLSPMLEMTPAEHLHHLSAISTTLFTAKPSQNCWLPKTRLTPRTIGKFRCGNILSMPVNFKIKLSCQFQAWITTEKLTLSVPLVFMKYPSTITLNSSYVKVQRKTGFSGAQDVLYFQTARISLRRRILVLSTFEQKCCWWAPWNPDQNFEL